ncbi:MAG: hypothetical protein ABI305_08600, partial [Tepidiformaceae bacterium]
TEHLRWCRGEHAQPHRDSDYAHRDANEDPHAHGYPDTDSDATNRDPTNRNATNRDAADEHSDPTAAIEHGDADAYGDSSEAVANFGWRWHDPHGHLY